LSIQKDADRQIVLNETGTLGTAASSMHYDARSFDKYENQSARSICFAAGK
jgi:hypothetical protein